MYFNHSLRLCLGTRELFLRGRAYQAAWLGSCNLLLSLRRLEKWHLHRCLGQLVPHGGMSVGLWHLLSSGVPVRKLPLTPAQQVSAISPPCSLRMAEWHLSYLGVVSPPLDILVLCIARGRDPVKGGNHPLSKACKEISFAVDEIPPYPLIPPHVERYQTLLPCALCTCGLFLHGKILYLVSCFCKPASLLVQAAALPTGGLCPGRSLFPPSARSFRLFPAFSLGVDFARSISSELLFLPSFSVFLWFPC